MKNTPEKYVAGRDSFAGKFFSLWIILYVLIFMATSQFSPVTSIPFVQHFIIWFGKTFLHLPDFEKIVRTGSGDTIFDYVTVLVNVVCSVVLAAVIAVADRKRGSYRQFYLFVIVLARYYVAFTMLTYGFAKVFNGQFGPVSYFSLERKFGDMSPMGVLWNFMDASRGYTFFGGLVEVIGGTLLLFRKTKTFGALFSMTVMINVAILNFAYDVPVKIFSTHIVLLCVFILSFEWRKLFSFFILHKAETLSYNRLSVKKKWMKITLVSVKALLIAFLLYSFFISRLFRPGPGAVSLEGFYTTKTFILNKDTLPPDPTDTIRWNNMYVVYTGGITVVRQEHQLSWYYASVDTSGNTISLKTNADSVAVYAFFNYVIHDDTLELDGHIRSDTANIVFTRKLRKDYPLLKRGFHWINEYPYNR